MACILVADDEPDIRRIIGIFLRRAGHEVIEARDGMEALAAFGQVRLDVAIMDVVMPGMTGIDVVRALRLMPDATGNTPVILLSARALPHEVAAGVETGADRYMVKPFSPAALVGAVDQMLRERSGELDAR